MKAQLVGAHLVMAGRLIDEEPEQAYKHAQAAQQLAPRLAATREALGLAAYLSDRYAEALAELRAARRITGSNHQWAVMADCERGLGRPEKALEMSQAPEAKELDKGDADRAADRRRRRAPGHGPGGRRRGAAPGRRPDPGADRAVDRAAALRLRRGAAGVRPRGRGPGVVRQGRRGRPGRAPPTPASGWPNSTGSTFSETEEDDEDDAELAGELEDEEDERRGRG